MALPLLEIAGKCCICPTPLGMAGCDTLNSGIAEAYYTCPSNLVAFTFAAEADCTDKAEITAFDIADTEPENLLQPINFVQLDDDTGAVHEFDDTSEGGNVTLNHTFRFKVNTSTPKEEAALNKMLGREVTVLVKYKNGRWRLINYTGGMVVRQKVGNSNQSWTEVVIQGRVKTAPLFVSWTDNGTWADANLISEALGGLLNI